MENLETQFSAWCRHNVKLTGSGGGGGSGTNVTPDEFYTAFYTAMNNKPGDIIAFCNVLQGQAQLSTSIPRTHGGGGGAQG